MHRRPFRRFVGGLAALMSIYLVLAITLSTTVDPWRIIGAPWGIKRLDDFREISENIRLGKAALANRGDWQAVILGSSRMEIALDATHRAFTGQRAVNLAMSAANLYETIAVGNYALDHNPGIQTIIIGVDAGDLHSEADSRRFTNFNETPLAGDHDRIEHAITWLIGGQAFADSISTVRDYFGHIPPKRDALGRMHKPNHLANLRQYVELNFSRGFETQADLWTTRQQTLCQAKADLLTKFLARARSRGIELHVVIPAQHALRAVHPTQNHPSMICDEHGLLVLTEICRTANEIPAKTQPIHLWNFLSFNDFTTVSMPALDAPSQQMPGWFDLGHVSKQAGDLMLDHMFEVRLNSQESLNIDNPDLLTCNWNIYKSNWLDAHRKYCITHSQDVAWWRSLAVKSLTNNPLSKHTSGLE